MATWLRTMAAMRVPRGRGAGLRSAFILSTVATVMAVTAVPVLANDHLASERASEAQPSKVLQASPDDHVMLVDGVRVLNIDICNADGSGCKPARNAKVTVKPRKGLKVAPKKGPQIKVTGNKAGTYELSFKQGKATGMTTVTINEPPSREPQEPSGSMPRLYLIPGDRTMQLGEEAIFETVGCTLVDGGRFGPNGIPDGVDDECFPLLIEEVNLPEIPGVHLIGPVGSRFGLRADEFPTDEEGPFLFVGPQVVTEIGGTVASATLEDAVFEPPTDVPAPPEPPAIVPWNLDATAQLEAFAASGGILGDANGNGTLDDEDPSAALSAYVLGTYLPALDYDGDGDMDAEDYEAAAIGGSMPNPAAPFGLPPGS